jgi:hypothetical protein
MSIAENFASTDNQIDSGHSFPNVEELRWGPDGGNARSPWALLMVRCRGAPGLSARDERSHARGIRLAGNGSQWQSRGETSLPRGLALKART